MVWPRYRRRQPLVGHRPEPRPLSVPIKQQAGHPQQDLPTPLSEPPNERDRWPEHAFRRACRPSLPPTPTAPHTRLRPTMQSSVTISASTAARVHRSLSRQPRARAHLGHRHGRPRRSQGHSWYPRCAFSRLPSATPAPAWAPGATSRPQTQRHGRRRRRWTRRR